MRKELGGGGGKGTEGREDRGRPKEKMLKGLDIAAWKTTSNSYSKMSWTEIYECPRHPGHYNYNMMMMMMTISASRTSHNRYWDQRGTDSSQLSFLSAPRKSKTLMASLVSSFFFSHQYTLSVLKERTDVSRQGLGDVASYHRIFSKLSATIDCPPSSSAFFLRLPFLPSSLSSFYF